MLSCPHHHPPLLLTDRSWWFLLWWVQVMERPQQMIMRVAVGIHKHDIEAAIHTYHCMCVPTPPSYLLPHRHPALPRRPAH